MPCYRYSYKVVDLSTGECEPRYRIFNKSNHERAWKFVMSLTDRYNRLGYRLKNRKLETGVVKEVLVSRERVKQPRKLRAKIRGRNL